MTASGGDSELPGQCVPGRPQKTNACEDRAETRARNALAGGGQHWNPEVTGEFSLETSETAPSPHTVVFDFSVLQPGDSTRALFWNAPCKRKTQQAAEDDEPRRTGWRRSAIPEQDVNSQLEV